MSVAFFIALVALIIILFWWKEEKVSEKSQYVSERAFNGKVMNFESNKAHSLKLVQWLYKSGLSIVTSEKAGVYIVDIVKESAATKTTEHYRASNAFYSIALLDAAYEFLRNQPTSIEPSY